MRPPLPLILAASSLGFYLTATAATQASEAANPRSEGGQTIAQEAKPKPNSEPLPPSGEKFPAQTQPGVVKALLVGGGSSHDFEKYFHKADSETLSTGGKVVTAYTANSLEALNLMQEADVIVISANHASFGTPEFHQGLNRFADAGHGVVVVHAGAWYNWAPTSGYNRRFVGGGTKSHGKGEFSVFNKQPTHPVMKGVAAEFKIIDEHYRVILDDGSPVEILAETGPEEKTQQPYPSVWLVKDPKAKIVGIALGHADEAHSHPAYQALLRNAVSWVSGK